MDALLVNFFVKVNCMHNIFSHRRFKDVDKSNHINDFVSSKKYLEIYLSTIIDRNTEEGDAACTEN